MRSFLPLVQRFPFSSWILPPLSLVISPSNPNSDLALFHLFCGGLREGLGLISCDGSVTVALRRLWFVLWWWRGREKLLKIVVVVGGFERILGLKKYILLLDLETREINDKGCHVYGFVIVAGFFCNCCWI